jgi:hypothetical protein
MRGVYNGGRNRTTHAENAPNSTMNHRTIYHPRPMKEKMLFRCSVSIIGAEQTTRR